MCKDRIFDNAFFNFFAYGRGNFNEPTRGYFLAFGIAFGCTLVGDLNIIAPLMSMFFMLTYALINLACFSGSFSKTPGWRPKFKYYNKWYVK